MTVTEPDFKRQLLRLTFQRPYTACSVAGRGLPVFTFQPFTYPCSSSNCVIFRVIIILARWQQQQQQQLLRRMVLSLECHYVAIRAVPLGQYSNIVRVSCVDHSTAKFILLKFIVSNSLNS